MKKGYKMVSAAVLLAAAALFCSAAPSSGDMNAPAKVRVVNFKKCIEQSKLGKQEQASFDALKKQMESALEEKEKVLNDMATKLEDTDYVDSLSPEAETEMKRKFRALSQEYAQIQNQYLQTLNQTNMKVLQNISDKVSEAAEAVAKQNNFDLVLNDEGSFFASPAFDISSQVITTMDQLFDKDAAAAKSGAVPAKK
jgi:outer membrane protein